MCEVCGQVSGHHLRCPEYNSRIGAVYICQNCGEGIHSGEEALFFEGKKICSECVEDMSRKELLQFIGFPMREVCVGERL